MGIAIINYKLGFLLYLLFQMIWYPDTQLFAIAGSWINLNFASAVYFAILYVLKVKRGKRTSFPYAKPMLFIGMSLLLTSFTSMSGFFSELIKAAGLILMELFIVYIIWQTVNSKSDFAFLFKGITVIVFLACIYTFYEKATGRNPVLDYKITCTTNLFETYRDFQQWDFRGYRCYSIFDHTIYACMTFSLYAALVVNLYVKKKKYPFKALSLFTAALCVPAMFFTQQRTGFFMLFIAVLPAIDFKRIRLWKLIGLAVIALIFLTPYISSNIGLLLSMVSSKYAAKVSGSSASMRFDQLDAVFHVMLISPLTGLGENFQRYYTGKYVARAMGYESLWFEQMAKHGVVGVLAYIYMIYYSVFVVPHKYKSKEIFFISLSYWMTYTLTSTPYFRTYFLYTILFYYIKSSSGYISHANLKLGDKRQGAKC